MIRKYEIDLTDLVTGATSPIDTQCVDGEYSAEQYVADCERNADPEWCDMLAGGIVEVFEIEVFDIECAETGENIDNGFTYDAAVEKIRRYEAEDVEDGTYTKGHYAIRNVETGERETIF